MIKEFGVYTCLIVFLTGCSTNFKLSPQVATNETQQTFYLDGDEVLLSEKSYTTVAILGGKNQAKEIELTLLILNISQERVDVIPDDIKVIGINSYGKHEELDVILPEQILKKIKNQNKINLITQAMYGFVAALNAGKNTTSVSGNVGNTPFSGTVKTYDYFKQYEAGILVNDELTNMKNAQESFFNIIKQSLLKKHSLFPNQQLVGSVMVKFKPMVEYIVEVPLGVDTHVFRFKPYPPLKSVATQENKHNEKIEENGGFYTKIKK